MGGAIKSKNHPSNYDNNYNEVWTLQPPEGHIIQLTFESFDIEGSNRCDYDWVEVSYGSYTEKFCGTSIPGPFTSTGPTMTVRMHTTRTGYETTRTGFRAVWGDSSSEVHDDFLWVGDNSMVDSSNWAQGFPESG